MIKKLEKAIRNLQKSSKAEPHSKFSYKDLHSESMFKAKVFYNEENKPTIKVFQVKGYNEDELMPQLTSSLKSIMHLTLPYAKSGSKIYTRHNADVGALVELRSNTYYYAIDSSIFDCSGEQLGSPFQAKCIGTQTAKCSPTSAIAQYTIFKLL